MYHKIMVPVDLGHKDKNDRAPDIGADLAIHCLIDTRYVTAASNAPRTFGRNLAEFERTPADLGAAEAERREIEANTSAVFRHDPAADHENARLQPARETLSAARIPHIADHLRPSQGGRLAGHADASVLIVR